MGWGKGTERQLEVPQPHPLMLLLLVPWRSMQTFLHTDTNTEGMAWGQAISPIYLSMESRPLPTTSQ